VNDTEQILLQGLGRPTPISNHHERDVVLSRKIEADSSRVLYALSIPEYIEAWLLVPNAEELQLVFKLEPPETFHINLYRSETLQAKIRGLCRVVNANQIRYSWKTTSSRSTTETLVDMQLLCVSGGCILGLKHSGFDDPVESVWYRTMWEMSLEQLCRILRRG
jgi:uncharacterized protein YndB with AHSA1/START domain